MAPLLLALFGLPAGLLLDRLVARLAVRVRDFEEEEELPQPVAPKRKRKRRRRASAETGSLVLSESWTSPESLRRISIVGATVLLFSLAGSRYDEPLHMAIVCAYLSVLIVCTATDLLAYRVPNAVTYPAMVGALIVASIMPGASPFDALAGAGLAGGALFVPALLTGGLGMGMGDVKLAAFCGLAVGFVFVVPALLVMAISGGAVAVFVLVTGIRKKGEPIPYAPFIALGGAVSILLYGTTFVSVY